MTASYPLKSGAACAFCMGPVDGFGCVTRCPESEHHRVDPYVHLTSPEARLHIVRGLTEAIIQSTKPEYVPEAIFTINKLAGGGR